MSTHVRVYLSTDPKNLSDTHYKVSQVSPEMFLRKEKRALTG